MNRERILVVEDDEVVMKVLEAKLQAEGYEVIGATEAIEAVHAVQEHKPDLMILDLTLVSDSFNGITDGFGVLEWIRHTVKDANFPVIIHTCDTSPKVDQQAMACDVFAVFRKGDCMKELMIAIREALDREAAKRLAGVECATS